MFVGHRLTTPLNSSRNFSVPFSDVEKIKEAAFWSDEEEKWVLPDLVIARTKFPPAGMFSHFREYQF